MNLTVFGFDCWCLHLPCVTVSLLVDWERFTKLTKATLVLGPKFKLNYASHGGQADGDLGETGLFDVLEGRGFVVVPVEFVPFVLSLLPR